ncbi:MAG: hypothetical protein LBU06_10435, partial [Desulfovibrio sp.]|nr:hypothetical protein [Desulfovibrio sp.]
MLEFHPGRMDQPGQGGLADAGVREGQRNRRCSNSDFTSHTGADRRILLDQLPRLLNGFGRTFAGYGDSYKAVVIVVCDLDDKNQ